MKRPTRPTSPTPRATWHAFWAALIVTAILLAALLNTLANRIREESTQPPLGELGPGLPLHTASRPAPVQTETPSSETNRMGTQGVLRSQPELTRTKPSQPAQGGH
jgi:hypothetical protein